MRRFFAILGFLYLFSISWAVDNTIIERFLVEGNIDGAQRALLEDYQKSINQEEQEQIQFLLAQLSLKQNKPEEAIAIYRYMLAKNPALSRVRLELGYLYFMQHEDVFASYHLRLVLSEKGLPPKLRQEIQAILETIRRRKTWQLYVSLGMTPDSNVNSMSGRQLECFNFMGAPFCRELDNIESDVGFQGLASLSYIQKLSNNWGLKGRIILDAIDYSNEQYSFWGIGTEFGMRYLAVDSENEIGVSYHQQWNDEHRYSYTKGVFGSASKDISDRISLSAKLAFNQVDYNDVIYQGYNSDNYGSFIRLFYVTNSRSYMTLSASLIYEDSQSDWNSNIRQRYALGYGRELPWGFNIYAEPNITFSNYQTERFFIGENNNLESLKRRDLTYGVYLSLSNKYLQFWDITPTVNFIYNKRLSNVYNYDYERTRWEIGLSRSF